MRGILHAWTLRTDPADRSAAEAAVGALYALLDRPPPEFVWAGSPAAALRLVSRLSPTRAADGTWPLECRLASRLSALRDRMDQRCGGRRDVWASRLHRQFDPEAALGAGATLSGLLDGGVRRALDRTVRRGLVGPLRSATAPRLGLLWLGQHDADWIADYDVRRRVGGVRFGPGDDAELDLWAVIARSCGWWWPREGRCVIVERPMGLHVEPVPDTPVGEVRLHNADGPAVTFRDATTATPGTAHRCLPG